MSVATKTIKSNYNPDWHEELLVKIKFENG